jgi:aconitate hydratase
MGKNLVEKVLGTHVVSGRISQGETIAISIDQTLFHDATGTMAALQFDALSLPRVKTKLSVAYIDHNTLQVGFENADDHRFFRPLLQIWTLLTSWQWDLPSSPS